jgi:hypothetical protein
MSPDMQPMPIPPPDEAARLRTQALIRISLLLGVLLFGGVTVFLHRRPGWAPASIDPTVFRILGIALWAIAVAGVVVLRPRLDVTGDPAQRQTINLIAWTLGEMVALYGGVYFFVTGDASRYVLGLVFMLATFVLFPVRRS